MLRIVGAAVVASIRKVGVDLIALRKAPFSVNRLYLQLLIAALHLVMNRRVWLNHGLAARPLTL